MSKYILTFISICRKMYICVVIHMEYISIHEISKKWHMKERKVTAFCREGRIAGARKNGKEWLIPSDALAPLDKRTKDFVNYTLEVKEQNTTVSYTESGGEAKVVDSYKKIYKRNPMYTTFTPYRLCLLGINYDFNKGKILGVTLDKGIHIAYATKLNGIIELISLQYPKRAQWHVLEPPIGIKEDWADPLRTAATELNKRYPLRIGISAVIDGELPVDGLSSSNTLIITFLNALAFANNIKLSLEELISIAKVSEKMNKITTNTKLDSMLEIYSKKNKITYIDTLDDTYNLISNNSKYDIVIFFSGLNNDYDLNIYNTRTDELKTTSYLIKGLSNLDYSTIKDTTIRDIPYELFTKYKKQLPNSFIKRTEHWYNELNRVDEGIKYYQKNDLLSFGKLITESGISSITNWETGSKELIDLFNIIKDKEGVYGTRFSGSGFKRCCIALTDPKYTKKVIDIVSKEYTDKYPKLKNKYSSHICHTADGVKL